jgi:predicted nucleotidyltransferase
MLDLNPKYIAIIQDILNNHIPRHVVWVYGSRIKGTAHEGSDLDLVIAPSERKISDEQLSAIKAAFSESDVPILIDINDWNTIPSQFKLEIEKKHEVFK